MERPKGAESQSQWLADLLKKVGPLPLVLSKEQAAEQLSIGRTLLDRLIASGQIRVIYYEPNGHPKILRSEIERFLAEKLEQAPRPKPPAQRRARTHRASLSDVDADVERLRAELKKRRR